MNGAGANEGDVIRQIKDIEQREARAVLRADVPALDRFWADDLLVNSSANLIAGKNILLQIIEDGRLRLRSYERLTLRISASDGIAVATGNESSELDGRGAGFTLFCSYMNLWRRRGEDWELFGRHVGLISRITIESTRRR
ncbi:MAG TPA: nuclear transport factor 2 family protein [Candidatus Binataceae bacterium]|nr:nuclear transport factor 2 family protein [Candidatus Binataceae bacterium]